MHSLFLTLALQTVGTALEMQLSRVLDLESVKRIQQPAEDVSALLGDGVALEVEDGIDQGSPGHWNKKKLLGMWTEARVESPRRYGGTFFSFASSVPSLERC